VESRKSEAPTLDLAAPQGGWLERLFKLSVHGTTVKTELIAGLTTFITMAYIIFVNPNIMADAGIDHGAAFVATCIAAALGCLLMGLYANWPVGLAPGMGLNAFFTTPWSAPWATTGKQRWVRCLSRACCSWA